MDYVALDMDNYHLEILILMPIKPYVILLNHGNN